MATLRAVQAVVDLTGDAQSKGRFRQLREIAEENALLASWDEAVESTWKAVQGGTLRERPGAYFNGTLTRILARYGVYVPVGSTGGTY